jgi:metallo-beta-lactamase family protein
VILDNDVLMYPPTKQKSDYVFFWSTYGDCLHPESDQVRIRNVCVIRSRWEGLSFTSFAVERAQMIMYLLWQLREG